MLKMKQKKNPSSIILVVISVIIISILAVAFFIAFGSQLGGTMQQEEDESFNFVEEDTQVEEQVQDFDKLKIITIQEGSGEEVQVGDTVSVYYSGTLIDGTKFADERGTPFEFTLGQGGIIIGWEEGVLGMKVGGVRELRIPSTKGYGEAGAGDLIPPNAGLIFSVELLEIK